MVASKIFGKKIFSNKTILLLSLIVLTSAVLRFWQLSQRFSWGGVEGAFIWDIWYVAAGHPTLIGFESAAIGGLNFPPFLLYFFVPFFWIFAGNPIYIGVILALLGVLTSALFFLIGKKIFSTKVGLIAALIYTISAQTITIDHKFIGGTFMVPVSLLVIFLLWQIYQKEEQKFTNLIILGSVIGLSFSAHYQAIFLFAGSFLFLFWYKRQVLSTKNVLIFLISILFWLTPLFLFDFRHNFYHLRGFITLIASYTHTATAAGFAVSGQYLLQNFLGLFWQPFYFFQFGKFGPLVILIFISAITASFHILLWRNVTLVKFAPLFFYFATLFLLGLIILSFYRSADYQFDYYYWYLVPPAIFLAAVTLDLVFQKNQALLGMILLFGFLAVNLNSFSKFSPSEPYEPVNQRVKLILQDAKKRGLSEIKVKFAGQEVGPYDYLFYWYSKKFEINSDSIVLISQREEYQERSILGSGRAPVKILPKGAGLNLKPDYLITAGGIQTF